MSEWVIKYWTEWFFGLIIAGMGWLLKRLYGKLKKERKAREEMARLAEEKTVALEDGMRALLRRQILIDCEAAQRAEWCAAKSKETISVMYEAYHRLGGNGVVTPTVRQVIDELPITPPSNH